MTNISKHPCANKCSNFKEEPCTHCLISSYPEIPDSSDYVLGDFVVYKDHARIQNHLIESVYEVIQINEDFVVTTGAGLDLLMMWDSEIRHASIAEIKAKRRLSDIHDDTHIENHISPGCRTFSNDESIFYSRALTAQKEVS
ncbi:hypothetical protein [Acinetobacter sp. NIPH 298]|uniref:hypothetical protein n=1 Tax=Acinetobacter sp. NIPH 298 TaxID=1217692 RepID=UPI0002D12FCC|nr:hypothetical protein [Acinetobacter sp. NIPH 298]ENW95755.1 hypothetical protein F903_01517 [Acinetobacter sp. NIPH 298]